MIIPISRDLFAALAKKDACVETVFICSSKKRSLDTPLDAHRCCSAAFVELGHCSHSHQIPPPCSTQNGVGRMTRGDRMGPHILQLVPETENGFHMIQTQRTGTNMVYEWSLKKRCIR